VVMEVLDMPQVGHGRPGMGVRDVASVGPPGPGLASVGETTRPGLAELQAAGAALLPQGSPWCTADKPDHSGLSHCQGTVVRETRRANSACTIRHRKRTGSSACMRQKTRLAEV
jgi:hypothetical protein